jgi:hypothetical protein
VWAGIEVDNDHELNVLVCVDLVASQKKERRSSKPLGILLKKKCRGARVL